MERMGVKKKGAYASNRANCPRLINAKWLTSKVDLRRKQTHSTQTLVSHFRRESETQHYPQKYVILSVLSGHRVVDHRLIGHKNLKLPEKRVATFPGRLTLSKDYEAKVAPNTRKEFWNWCLKNDFGWHSYLLGLEMK
jgi:hypothetical protein